MKNMTWDSISHFRALSCTQSEGGVLLPNLSAHPSLSESAQLHCAASRQWDVTGTCTQNGVWLCLLAKLGFKFHWKIFEDESEELLCAPFYWAVYPSQLCHGFAILRWLLCYWRNEQQNHSKVTFVGEFLWTAYKLLNSGINSWYFPSYLFPLFSITEHWKDAFSSEDSQNSS